VRISALVTAANARLEGNPTLVLEALRPPQRDGDVRRLASPALHTACQAAVQTAVHDMVPGGLYEALVSSPGSNNKSSCSSSGGDDLACSHVAPEATIKKMHHRVRVCRTHMPVYIFCNWLLSNLKKTQISGYTHQALFETLNLTLKLKIFL
jgi:hypothetical protein